nr:uncharacterized protein LOC109398944 [Aedes albopictus]
MDNPFHKSLILYLSYVSFNLIITDATATREMQQQPERFYCTAEDIIFLPDTMYDQANLEDHVITDSTGTVKYQDLKKDLQSFIEVTVENAVKKHVGEHFSRLAALTVMNAKAPTQTVPEKVDDPVENHQRIDNEPELHEWNVKLASEDLRAKYLIYFTRVIPPNSYVSNGDNACYTIVDCLFTREFWTRFTWTGISRGQKSKRGFREFGNVLQLLVDLVCIGDPSYSAHKLEDFCRTRLFRYSMSRSTNKRLRKSACRPERKLKKMHQQSIDNPAELVDVVQSDSAEEPGNDQDEMMDVKTNEANSENDNYADDEDVFNASDNEALDESDSDD